MTALVTGATGFVGGAVVRALLERGYAVRALARRTSKTQPLEALGVEIVYGDVLEPASLEAALRGCETLYHVAAAYDFWVADKQAMLRTDIEGTRNALEAARRMKPAKVVYTSTNLAIGEPRGTVGTEATTHRGYFLGFYEKAKYEAEQVARRYASEGLPVVIVNPSAVYGPGDFKPSGRGLLDVLNGRVPMIMRGAPFATVYVDDVGTGHVLAAEKGRVGERYLLCERNVTTQEWLETACRLAGRKPPPVGPEIALRLVAELGELGARFTQRPPLLAKDNFKLIQHGAAMDGSKARDQLGLRYTPIEKGLAATLAWYWANGHLKHKPACLA